MSYRLRYIPGTAYGERFPSIRYPHRGDFATREHAQKALEAMPSADQMEVIDLEEDTA